MKRGILGALLGLLIAACGSSGTSTHTVSGTVSGLNGTVVLLLNGDTTDPQTVTGDGSFQFAKPVASGSNYVVTVVQEPNLTTCLVNNGAGVMGNSDITNVTVTCGAEFGSYTLSGTISGIGTDGLHPVQLANGNDVITVSTDGAFSFPNPLNGGESYNVQLAQASSGFSCTLQNASGTVQISNVSNVVVTCQASTTLPVFFLSVEVSGLTVGTATVSDGISTDANNPLEFDLNSGTLNFAHLFYNGEGFALTLTSTYNETCVFDSTGTASVSGSVTADTKFTVTCTPAVPYYVSVNVTGLTVGTATVSNGQSGDANNPLVFSSSSAATQQFLHPYPSGSHYVLVVQNSNNETCQFTGSVASSGTITGNVTVNVACGPAPTYFVEVQVTGLTTGNANVTNNMAGDSNNPLIFGTNATQQFNHQYLGGENYNIVLTSSNDEGCYFTNGGSTGGVTRTGAISGNLILNVTCAPTPFAITVSAQNLLDSNSITVTDANSYHVTLSNTLGDSNTIPHAYYVGNHYTVNFAVTGSQTCYFANTTSTSASGTVGLGNVELVIMCQPYNLTVYAPNLTSGQIILSDAPAGDPNYILTPATDRYTFPHGFLPTNPYTVNFSSTAQNCNFFGTGSPALSGSVSGTFTTSGNVELLLECQ